MALTEASRRNTDVWGRGRRFGTPLRTRFHEPGTSDPSRSRCDVECWWLASFPDTGSDREPDLEYEVHRHPSRGREVLVRPLSLSRRQPYPSPVEVRTGICLSSTPDRISEPLPAASALTRPGPSKSPTGLSLACIRKSSRAVDDSYVAVYCALVRESELRATGGSSPPPAHRLCPRVDAVAPTALPDVASA